MITRIELAKEEGAKSAAEYRHEFGVSPRSDGADDVGDWDSTAWGIAWGYLKAHHGATTEDHAACLEAWREGFWA